ncbi:his operon leader peptide, partial [Klebsiella pneumoniae]|nr:his operon leader peptide [Klebsiella pneumoniae]HCL5277607.1 his operon leader peptide [Salmonella enterica]HDV8394004.1 his operon leader peptide [Escherichia coli]
MTRVQFKHHHHH